MPDNHAHDRQMPPADEPQAGPLGPSSLMRFTARHMQGGPGLPTVAGYVFMGTGAVMILGGIAMAFHDPAALALVGFGVVFAGAGWGARKLFTPPKGQKTVPVDTQTAVIRRTDGTRGTRRQSVLIRVPETATDAEIDDARKAWVRDQFNRRGDWAAGRIEAEDVRGGSLLCAGAVVWSLFALGALAAALIWGDIAWLVALGALPLAGMRIVMAWRAAKRRRKFGVNTLVSDRLPALLGGALEGEIETGLAKTTVLRDGFQLTLTCLHRWEDTSGHGDNKRRRLRVDTLWQADQRSAGYAPSRRETLAIPFTFEIPDDQPPTTLGGGTEGISWQLTASATMPGLDYQATFDVPVLAADTLASK